MRFKVVPNQKFRGVNMNSNIEKNITIEYDENIIRKIKEIIKKGVKKLESFVKSKTKPDLSFYTELEKEFDDITSKLEELELWMERRYFLSIEDKILYIVYENSNNPDFGHCNFALELLNFFIEIFKTNTMFYNDESEFNQKEFTDHQNYFKKRYHEYRSVFYQEIYQSSGEYGENELYEFLKELKE